jgi:hypothetical protein
MTETRSKVPFKDTAAVLHRMLSESVTVPRQSSRRERERAVHAARAVDVDDGARKQSTALPVVRVLVSSGLGGHRSHAARGRLHALTP